MITKKFGKDFDSDVGALTLSPLFICKNTSGWTIEGEIHEDCYEYVHDFKATHDKYGEVWGDFEKEVYADSEEGFQDFWNHHKPDSWDYGDI